MPSDLVYVYASKYSLNPLDLESFVQFFGFGYAEAAQCSFDDEHQVNYAYELDDFLTWVDPSTSESYDIDEVVIELCHNNHDVVERCAMFLSENWQDIEEYENLLSASAGFKFALETLQCGASFLDAGKGDLFERLSNSVYIINQQYSSIVEGITVYLDDKGIYRIMLGQGERQEPIEFAGHLA